MPEFIDPEAPMRLTLFDDVENGPDIWAYIAPELWETFYVPKLTVPLMAYYIGQCAAMDRNGEWTDFVPRYLGWDTHDDFDVRIAINNEVYKPVIGLDRTRAARITFANAGGLLYAMDRLPWRRSRAPINPHSLSALQ